MITACANMDYAPSGKRSRRPVQEHEPACVIPVQVTVLGAAAPDVVRSVNTFITVDRWIGNCSHASVVHDTA